MHFVTNDKFYNDFYVTRIKITFPFRDNEGEISISKHIARQSNKIKGEFIRRKNFLLFLFSFSCSFNSTMSDFLLEKKWSKKYFYVAGGTLERLYFPTLDCCLFTLVEWPLACRTPVGIQRLITIIHLGLLKWKFCLEKIDLLTFTLENVNKSQTSSPLAGHLDTHRTSDEIIELTFL